MFSLRIMILNAILAMVFLTLSASSYGEVLELGESQLHGKKDQPEAMTFISRVQTDTSIPVVEPKIAHKISDEIKKDVFKLSTADHMK